MARLPAPSLSLAARSVPSFKPQMATRAPSLANSCAAASPIPLFPPVIRIFLLASLPIVVTPLDEARSKRLAMVSHAGLVVPLQTAPFASFISIMRSTILHGHAFLDGPLSCRAELVFGICRPDESRRSEEGAEGERGDEGLHLRLH